MTFENLNSLETLNLQNNKLMHVHEDVMEPVLDTLRVIDIMGEITESTPYTLFALFTFIETEPFRGKSDISRLIFNWFDDNAIYKLTQVFPLTNAVKLAILA